MNRDSSLHDYVVHDLLGDTPGIASKAMFSGWALYKYGTVFGIIAEGRLYFKVGEGNRADFESMGSQPFVYKRKDGKRITMSYWLVPEEAMEDRERLHMLVEKSVEARKRGRSKTS